MSEVTVSAKDKKKSKTDKDRRSDVRIGADRDVEDLERAIRKSQKEERKKAKEKAKEEKEMANGERTGKGLGAIQTRSRTRSERT